MPALKRRAARRKYGKRVYNGEPISKLRRAMKLDVPETKTWLTGTQSSITTSGSVVNLVAGLIRGTGPNDRIGNHIRCQRLHYSLALQSNAASSDFFRVLVVRQKGDTNGVAPSFQDILNCYSVSAPADIVAPYNLDNVPSSYSVVLDKRVAFQSNGDGKLIKGSVKLRDRQTSFNANSGIASDVADGCYYALMIPMQNTMVTTYAFRLEYFDV